MPKIRVMVVDDSVVVRGLLRRIINAAADMEVVETCADGEVAVRRYSEVAPDIVLMDVEMPRMDGIEAVRRILQTDEAARIIMCSSLTQKGAQTALEALEAGAVDCLGKPTAQTLENGHSFEETLLHKIRTLRKMRKLATKTAGFTLPVNRLRNITPAVIAIGASTGGPRALGELLSQWEQPPTCPVLITQHIPSGFSAQLARHLERQSGFPACEAQDGMALENGHIYIAPGGQHLTVSQEDSPAILLSSAPPLNFCRPSVDMMLLSLAIAYKRDILTIILTGMGEDGRVGCNTLKHQSEDNMILVQDEASSVVWGMPGAVVKAGAAHAVLPISGIAARVNQMMRNAQVV